MDLFHKIGLPAFPWSDNVKVPSEEESKSIKLVIIRNSEMFYMLEMDRKVDELSNEHLMGLYYLTNLQVENFLKLKYFIIRDDLSIFLTFKKADMQLTDYLTNREPSVELRLLIFRGAIEIIYNLILLNEDFSQFDQSLFFIEEKEFSTNEKFPILKFIYHDYKKHPSSWESILETLISTEPYQNEIKFLSDYLSDTISGKNLALLPINNFIDLFNSILRKANFEEISMHILQANMGVGCKNNISLLLSKKQNIQNNNNNLLCNSQVINTFSNTPTLDHFFYPSLNNALGMNFNMFPPDANLNPYYSSPNYFSKPNLHSNSNYNNSQINYNQYFQFFNNHNILNSAHGAVQGNFINSQHTTGNTVNNNIKQVQNNSNLLPQNLNFLNSPISMKQGLGFIQDSLSNFQNPLFNTFSQLGGVKTFNQPQFTVNNNGNAMPTMSTTHLNPVNQVFPMNQMSLLNFNIADVKKLSELKSYMEGLYNNSNIPNNPNNFSNILTNTNFNNQRIAENNFDKLQFSAKQPTYSQEKNKILKVDNLFNDKSEKRNLNLNNYKSLSKQANKNTSHNKTASVEKIKLMNNRLKSLPVNKNSGEYIKNANGSILIIVKKKILTDNPELNTSNISNKSETASLCSEEEREMLRRKRNNDENCVNNENETSRDKASNKKKLRVVPSNSSKYYNWDTPYKSICNTDFNDNDLEMINKINNPRRKKINGESIPRQHQEKYFYPEKTQALKEELNEFYPLYEDEIKKVADDKSHIFMKQHFPLMYNVENFYLYLYKYPKDRREKNLILEFKKDKKHEKHEKDEENKKIELNLKEDPGILNEKPKIQNLESNEKCKKSEDQSSSPVDEKKPKIELIEAKITKLWDCNHKDDVEVENYLFNVEKIWPIEQYIYSQEAALKLLMNNNYIIEESIEKIKNISNDFEQILLDKKLSKECNINIMDQIYSTSGKVSKRIHFSKMRRLHGL